MVLESGLFHKNTKKYNFNDLVNITYIMKLWSVDQMNGEL